MKAEVIDAKMHIDTHYGAIASKAVKLQPSELNVPDKGKAEFQKLFGESWDAAVKEGKVYNAKDGAVKLGTDASGLNDLWSKLDKKKDLVKFRRWILLRKGRQDLHYQRLLHGNEIGLHQSR
jgi:hypothetical protein